MLRTRIRGAAVAGVLCALAAAAVFPAAGSALAASPSIQAASAAASPPDDHGLIVAERAHVDSPKVYWADGGFDLRAGIGSAVHPIDNTINSLGHGYDRQGRPTFLFTVPRMHPSLRSWATRAKPGTPPRPSRTCRTNPSGLPTGHELPGSHRIAFDRR